jgi:hypothetical protein
MPRPKKVQDSGRLLDDPTYPLKYIICRAFTHSWDDLGVMPVVMKDGQKAYERLLRCTGCGFQKWDFESRSTGKVWKTKRQQPPGYKLAYKYSMADCRHEVQNRRGRVRFQSAG